MMTLESQHETVNELLPWHASEALSTDEREMVEIHLEHCQACRDELALLQEVGVAARENAENIPPVPNLLPQALARIEEWEQTQAPARSERSELGGWLRDFVDQLWNPPVPLARAVFAMQFAVILVVGGLWLFSGSSDSEFTTLSGGGGASDGARLTVIFRPGTTEETMRRALLDLDVSIVSGPSALGVYVIALPVEETETEAVDAAIEAFRSNSSVVDFVERQP